MTQINFELVSPEEKLISEPIHMAVIPGSEGEIGVGAGHASFVVALKSGVVQLFQNENQEPRKIFIAGGFADITSENCTVLAEQAVNVNDLDAKALEQDLVDLNENLTLAVEDIDQERIRSKIAFVKAKLSAVTGELVL